MIKAVIFDWGNVLEFIDHGKFISKMSGFFGVDEARFEEVELRYRLKHDLGLISTGEYVRGLGRELKIHTTIREYYALMDRFKVTRLNLGLLTFITTLRKKLKVFLLTNNSRPTYLAIGKMGYDSYFDKMLFSFQAGMKKPDHRFFMKLLKGTSLAPQECLLIDDRPDTCESAERFGMQTVVYLNNRQLMKDLAARLAH